MSSPFISTLDDIANSTLPIQSGMDLHKIFQTNTYSQISTVYLDPEKSIGFERHVNPPSDQIILVLEGKGTAMLGRDIDDKDVRFYEIYKGVFLTVPAGIRHEFYNTSEDLPMKLLIIYAPPIH